MVLHRFTSFSFVRTLAHPALLSGLLSGVLYAAPGDFTDITTASGIDFTHTNGASGEKYLPETFGSGTIWFDVDADGHIDLLFLNGTAWPGSNDAPTYAALFRNLGDGTFVDITDGSGLAVPLYGMGGTAADFDNDGCQAP